LPTYSLAWAAVMVGGSAASAVTAATRVTPARTATVRRTLKGGLLTVGAVIGYGPAATGAKSSKHRPGGVQRIVTGR